MSLTLTLHLTLSLFFTTTQADLEVLRAYGTCKDIDVYVIVLKKVLSLFGAAIHESLTRTMGKYLEVTGGEFNNRHKSEWEKEISRRMTCTNNGAESPFATVRAFLDIYPRSYLLHATVHHYLIHLFKTFTYPTNITFPN